MKQPDDSYLVVAAIRQNLNNEDLNEVPLAALHKFASVIANYCSNRLYVEDFWSEQTDELLKSLFPAKEELKPCPFCGFKPDEDHDDCIYPVFSPKNKPRLVSLNCYDSAGGCGAQVLAESKEAAIKRWNNRVS